MKRITRKTLVIAAVLLVLAIVTGTAAYGYFFSGQTIANNKIKTGNITLQLNHGAAVLPIDLDGGNHDIMPGDYGTVGNYLITNIGTTHASLYVGVTPSGEWNSDLANVTMGAFWLDNISSTQGVWDNGDAYFVPNGQFVNYTAGDGSSVPSVAFRPMSDWRSSLSNTMNVEVGDLGYLKFSYLLPSDVVDSQEHPLMGKSINFDLLVQLDQWHPLEHSVTIQAVSGHAGATYSAYANGFLVKTGTVTGDGFSFNLPSNTYTLVFSHNGNTATRAGVDVSTQNYLLELPATFNNGAF